MKRVKIGILIFSLFAIIFPAIGQMDASYEKNGSSDYSDCGAIFFNGKMLVNEYSPRGKCQILTADGEITLSAVKLSKDGGEATDPLLFKVAILHAQTNTLRIFSDRSYSKIMLSEITKECSREDKIIIMTEDKRYNLSHHTIDLK